MLDELAARIESKSPFARISVSDTAGSIPPPPPTFRLATGETPPPGILKREDVAGAAKSEEKPAEAKPAEATPAEAKPVDEKKPDAERKPGEDEKAEGDEDDAGIEVVTKDDSSPKVIIDLEGSRASKKPPSSRPSAYGDLTPPPKRSVFGVLAGVLLALGILALGVYLFYRPGAGAGRGRDVASTPADAEWVALADTAAVAPDEGAAPAADAATGWEPAADAGVSADVPSVPAADALTGWEPDAAPYAADVPLLPSEDVPVLPVDDAALVAPAADVAAVLPVAAGCAEALEAAKAQWRGRQREEAVRTLIGAFGCPDVGLAAAQQAAQWVSEAGGTTSRPEFCSELATALTPVAEANPNDGKLWFFYVDLLYKARRRDEADAAKTRCRAIRPRDDYSSSCAYLPE